MSVYYLAIDIGASSGRHILGHMENGRMQLEEIYRFPNGMVEVNGEKTWDVEKLFSEIINGLKKCRELNKIPVSMGIDTWGVDFALLDGKGNRLGNVVAYRDSRTNGMDSEVYKIIHEDKLYARNGIQKAIFNTIYQLMAVKKNHPEYLDNADAMLMMPDYFAYLLTGEQAQEYTNATTGQLVDPETMDWDYELIDMLGFPRKIFKDIHIPGTRLGKLKPEIEAEIGFNTIVMFPATHDTGSAVMAVPSNSDNVIYISSGTWSLMGTEIMKADCSEESRKRNFTNEGGYDYRFRYLKNIMGLWMIQSVRNELAPELSFGDICDGAAKCDIDSLVDANDARFLAPDNMSMEVKAACRESGQKVPETIYELAKVIYRSLAVCYGKTVREIEEMTGVKYDGIHVVGGGSNAVYLNELTARETGLTVYAGPGEATAIGNLACQMIANGELKDLQDARNVIFTSFEVKTYK